MVLIACKAASKGVTLAEWGQGYKARAKPTIKLGESLLLISFFRAIEAMGLSNQLCGEVGDSVFTALAYSLSP